MITTQQDDYYISDSSADGFCCPHFLGLSGIGTVSITAGTVPIVRDKKTKLNKTTEVQRLGPIRGEGPLAEGGRVVVRVLAGNHRESDNLNCHNLQILKFNHFVSYKPLSLTFRSLVVRNRKPCCSEHEALIILARSLMTLSNWRVFIFQANGNSLILMQSYENYPYTPRKKSSQKPF